MDRQYFLFLVLKNRLAKMLEFWQTKWEGQKRAVCGKPSPGALLTSQGFALDLAGVFVGLGGDEGHAFCFLQHHWPQQCCQWLSCMGRGMAPVPNKMVCHMCWRGQGREPLLLNGGDDGWMSWTLKRPELQSLATKDRPWHTSTPTFSHRPLHTDLNKAFDFKKHRGNCVSAPPKLTSVVL